MQDNVLGRRSELVKLISQGAIDQRVLELLVPDGKPLPDEDFFWDYKEQLPILKANPSREDKDDYAYKMGEICKDVVSFFNTYGGYLVIGVTDTDRSICGFDKAFDVNDLCKKITGATRQTVDVKFRLISDETEASNQTLGLVLIPKRASEAEPVQFLKDGPESSSRKRGFLKNDLYMRSREECRKAITASDFALLFQRDRIGLNVAKTPSIYIENNLPARDPSLIEFVGRDEQMDLLWSWFTDRYTAVKLLSGPGGVGKTSIAWTFSDAVSRSAPSNLDKVIWLTAKKKTYAALLGKYVEIDHTHFSDLEGLLRSILGELGVPENLLPEAGAREDLIDECISSIKTVPCLLIVDDIDSLPTEEQYDVFRTISTIFDRVIASGIPRARALLTARLNLGAAPGQLLNVKGLILDDFREFVINAAQAIEAPLGAGPNLEFAIKRLHEASNGSPLFAGSILRLVAGGESLSKAIKQHRGAEGEEVRKFAFEKELEALTDSQLRVLFAAMHFADCSLSDIMTVTQSNRTAIRDDVAGLRNYHLMTVTNPSGDFVRDDPRIAVPAEISSMLDIVRKKVVDPKRIESNCAKLNRSVDQADRELARYFTKVVEYWTQNDFDLAVETAEFGSQKYGRNPDIWCLLGRAYLKGPKPDPRKADASLRKASELGSVRPELVPLRIEAKEALSDWIGIIQLLESVDQKLWRSSDTYAVARANKIIGDEQVSVGNWIAAESNFLRGASVIQKCFNLRRSAELHVQLTSLKTDLMISYMNTVIGRIARDADKIEIWDAMIKMFDLDVYHRNLAASGINALVEWTNSASRRGDYSETTLSRIQGATQFLPRLVTKLEFLEKGWKPVVHLASVAHTKMKHAAVEYRSRLEEYNRNEKN